MFCTCSRICSTATFRSIACWLSWGVANWRGCFEASANAGGAPMVGLRCRLVAVASPAYVLLRLPLADASRPRSHSKPRSMWTVSASVVGRYQGTVCLKEYLFILNYIVYIYILIFIYYISIHYYLLGLVEAHIPITIRSPRARHQPARLCLPSRDQSLPSLHVSIIEL